jgi:hypothetical protein
VSRTATSVRRAPSGRNARYLHRPEDLSSSNAPPMARPVATSSAQRARVPMHSAQGSESQGQGTVPTRGTTASPGHRGRPLTVNPEPSAKHAGTFDPREPAYLGPAQQRLGSQVVFTIGCYQLLCHKPAPSPVQEGTGTYRTILRRHVTPGLPIHRSCREPRLAVPSGRTAVRQASSSCAMICDHAIWESPPNEDQSPDVQSPAPS